MLVILFFNFSNIGCSGAITMNVAPKIVSGLVVYTFNFSFAFSISKSISAPSDLPIQLI